MNFRFLKTVARRTKCNGPYAPLLATQNQRQENAMRTSQGTSKFRRTDETLETSVETMKQQKQVSRKLRAKRRRLLDVLVKETTPPTDELKPHFFRPGSGMYLLPDSAWAITTSHFHGRHPRDLLPLVRKKS